MNKKSKNIKIKGFTLIELLAVVVILAIVSLIAIPTVLNILENAKEGAFKAGMYSLFDAYKYKEAERNFENIGELDISELDLKNNRYSIGKVNKNINKDIEIKNVSDGNYCANGILEDLQIISGDCSNLDSTVPVIKNLALIKTTNSIEAVVSFSEPDSFIKSYEFRLLDNSDNVVIDWVSGDSLTGSGNNRVTTKTFNNLIQNTTYKVEVKITNSSDNEINYVEEIEEVTLNSFNAPVIEYNTSNWELSKSVTITFSSGITNSYKILDEEDNVVIDWVEVTTNPTIIIDNINYTVLSKSTDGVTTLSDSSQIGYIDRVNPTIEITNISNTWGINDEISISVNDSLSGVNSYCITTNNDTSSCEWNDITDLNYIINSNGMYYAYSKDNVGNISLPYEFEIEKVDKTEPINVRGDILSTTTKSIEVKANGNDIESGITKYEFSKNNGETWIDNGLEDTYTFENLTSGTYNIKVRLTNGSDLKTISESIIGTTVVMTSPTAVVDIAGWATEKTVTITYPLGFTNYYKINDGSWLLVEGNSKEIAVTETGTTVQARTYDGTNYSGSDSITVSNIDRETPTLSLTKSTYYEGFDGWEFENSAYVSNDILYLPSTNSSAISNYYDVNESEWYFTADFKTETASQEFTPDGGIHLNSGYYDASYNAYVANNGYSGNGYAPAIFLNNWNPITWDGYGGFGSKYLKLHVLTGDIYSAPPISVRNFKLYGQLYSTFYDISITKSDVTSGIKTVKYAFGNKDKLYFMTSGAVVINDTIRVTNNGTYTVYVEDNAGNGVISTIEITKIDNNNPVIATNTPVQAEIDVNTSGDILSYFTYNQNGTANIIEKTCVDTSDNNSIVTNTRTLAAGTHNIVCTVKKANKLTASASKTIIVRGIEYTFDYTGDSQTFTVPVSGTYKIELWGAQGGSNVRNIVGGAGAYTSGNIRLTSNNNIYVIVGSTSGYNGGGSPGLNCYANNIGGYGGGATDIRLSLTSGISSNTSLATRIMVAGAGAGSGGSVGRDQYETNSRTGLPAQSINVTGCGISLGSYASDGMCNTGGDLTSIFSTRGENGTAGTFGNGGNGGRTGAYIGGHTSYQDIYSGGTGGGGGAGYYGGGGGGAGGGWWSATGGSGGGGSSYISGHTGSIAITSATNLIEKSGCTEGTTNINCSYHYSNYIFTNTKIIDGQGYSWSGSRGSTIIGMPTQDGTNIMSGNTGNGYAKITLIKAD